MGTDIHAFVEFDRGRGDPFGAGADIVCFNRGEFFVPNDYDLLNALGDGRSHSLHPDEVRRWSLVPPRGLPSNASQTVLDLYYHPVLRPGGQPGRASSWWHELPPVTRDDADRWVTEGLSHFAPVPPARVSNPDWHTPSWLLLAEVYDALAHFGLAAENLPAEFLVVLRVMAEFEALVGPGRSRLVFWYDN
ncbi:hypothetical protein J0H58_19510 [bacterium]|nr:hypothetical protein [bacterium]